LSRRTNVVHGNDLTDRQLARMVEAGVTFSVAPEIELGMGHGFPITRRLRRLGVVPSIGTDVEPVAAGDLLTATRIALSVHRAFDNDEHVRTFGRLPDTATVTARDALEWITAGGAQMLGMEDRIGTLAPGKQADVIMVRADDLNVAPVHDPIATVLMNANASNVENVMVAGEWKKRGGRLTFPDVDALLRELEASGERIVGRMNGV
jgi:cytosine/adenosine deaminase-related metal-dependent hydrolase